MFQQHDRTNLIRSRPARSLVLAALAPIGVAAVSAEAQVGTFSIRVDNGALVSTECFAEPGAEPGTLRFHGASADASGKWEASWDFSADLDPNANAKINGTCTVLNKSGEAAEYDATFRVPVCPHIMVGSKMGGACTIKIIMNENGGAISTPAGSNVWTAMADDGIGAKLFYGPFNMGSTGSGTAQTSNLFGAPFPAMSAPAVGEDFGVRHVFKLTDGDTAVITSNLVLCGEAVNFVACEDADSMQMVAPPDSDADEAGGNAPNGGNVVAVPAAPGSPSSSSAKIGNGNDSRVTISDSPRKSPNSASAAKKRAQQKASSASKSKRTSANRNRVAKPKNSTAKASR